jgi:hypothetical protein
MEDKMITDKSAKKECKKYLNDLFIKSGFEGIEFVERTTYYLDNKTNILTKDTHFITEQSFPLRSDKEVDNMKKQIHESQWRKHELLRYFKPECVIQIGQKLDGLSDLEKLNGDLEYGFYKFEDGKVNLIYLWTIYKSLCKKQLKELNDLLIKNGWERHVKFSSINTDSNREYAAKMLRSINIHKMEHLYIDTVKHPNHPVYNVIDKYGFPVCIFVNNDQYIEFVGSLFEIDLEKKIKDLLERNFATTTTGFAKFQKNKNEKAKLKEIKQNLELIKPEYFKRNFKAPHLCGAELVIKKLYTTTLDDKQPYSYNNKLHYYCHPHDSEAMDELFTGMDELKYLKVSKNYVMTFELEYGTICSSCQCTLDNVPQYYCHPCKLHFCIDCGEHVTDINVYNNMHKHFLYVLHPGTKYFMKYIVAYNPDESFEFDFKYFEENKAPKFINDIKTHYQVKCDGCLSFPIKTTRWKCCNCLFKNLCNVCKDLMNNKDHQFYEEILYNLMVAGCNPLEHVFLKVVFDIFSY